MAVHMDGTEAKLTVNKWVILVRYRREAAVTSKNPILEVVGICYDFGIPRPELTVLLEVAHS
jgi:hypothetical protein